ncbi:hypothetical protein GUITHDRAFT_141326 [Guillardia theta CCMP2712]|uniref:Transmembrane protein n=1 Tax=Guillardia theta (strain CCMP2712) TaxID=905079 RepID=L1J264_GUITC|nr:hypothetical protein GUITHDRAFT_141326 [Guillardia theta CCMP2712]EKX42382.1 hypothetical protein GUITHDRAFT_141326 [Guillardia theta CCMP2712]|eukprot:XP_005829362.1 hypothetical protein GUITHDRAFT_141326 [Guillardia theta CCMP2712]
MAFKEPTQAEFFTALAVFGLVLVVTSVFMTQKPPWMAGEEADLGVSSPYQTPASPPDEYSEEEMQEMQGTQAEKALKTQSLAVRGKQRLLSGKAAVALAASHPGGMIHTDDSYITVGSRPRTQSLARSSKVSQQARPVLKYRGQDRVVSLRNVQPSMYPMMGLAEAPQSSSTPNQHFAEAIRKVHAGDGEVSVPPITRLENGLDDVGGDREAHAVDSADADRWAYYGAIFIVLVGSAIVLLYNLLPKGSIERAMAGDIGVYDQYPKDGKSSDSQGQEKVEKDNRGMRSYNVDADTSDRVQMSSIERDLRLI